MSDPKKASLVTVWIIAGGLLTPLCGLWFSCGCDWPWGGFFMACNAIVKNTAPPHCPWCVHPVMAAVSIGISLVASTIATSKVGNFSSKSYAARLYRIAVGTAVFVSTLSTGAWVGALATGYPLFLGMRLS